MLGDAKRARENFDLLANHAGSIAGFVAPRPSAARSRLTAAWNSALDRFIADPAIATDDRLVAVNAKIELAKLDAAEGDRCRSRCSRPCATEAERADRETTDVYARQSVISGAADILAEAGLLAESDALLTTRARALPFPVLLHARPRGQCKKRGDKAGALDWAEKAYAAAKGPATRLQWGVSYVRTLIATAPEDAARIERVAGQIIGELEATPETFYERNRRALERMGRELAAWNKDKRHDASVRRIRAEMATRVREAAGRPIPARATCDGALRPEGVDAARPRGTF